ncbi:hypothetical protein N7462_007913 [Penicillium macrosclerotiorum]|uniref:uncharacterized protein n=1 Tax=Penicillium macrosclerotiorum TaxID=303699 RepID=UPI002548A30D|nr:uncharacterized protein N7462_007913 [Penicillium macrosclerotiorum]KAJ5679669.1 hypothetical protein N7462_007913 [Penicillium macrosclerotiorum]
MERSISSHPLVYRKRALRPGGKEERVREMKEWAIPPGSGAAEILVQLALGSTQALRHPALSRSRRKTDSSPIGRGWTRRKGETPVTKSPKVTRAS